MTFSDQEIERFWVKIRKTESCWVWTGSTRGRAQCRYGGHKVGGKTWGAHRVSYVIHFGPIPDGLWVLHKCDNPLCVRPDHIYAGTPSQNIQDKYDRNRDNRAMGERNNHAKLNEAQVLTIRARYEEGNIGCTELAIEYGVARTLIGMIVRGEIWAHVGGPRSLRPFIRSNTGYRGVSKMQDGRFQVYITHNHKRTSIATVHDPEKGARIYDDHARRLHGEKAILNFPN